MRRIFIVLVAGVFIAGCGSTALYRNALRQQPSYNSRDFAVSGDTLYQAVLRAVYSRNFLVETEDKGKGFILAKQAFQHGRKTLVLLLQAKVDTRKEGLSTLYLNLMETTEKSYVSDRTRFLLFIIPLPGGGGKQATVVKESERMVKDKTCYQDFFDSVEKEVSEAVSVEEKIPDPVQTEAEIPVEPEPPPDPIGSEMNEPAARESETSADL